MRWKTTGKNQCNSTIETNTGGQKKKFHFILFFEPNTIAPVIVLRNDYHSISFSRKRSANEQKKIHYSDNFENNCARYMMFHFFFFSFRILHIRDSHRYNWSSMFHGFFFCIVFPQSHNFDLCMCSCLSKSVATK